MYFIIIAEAANLCSGLQIIETTGVHACPGRILTLECTVRGEVGDATVWNGTAFSGCDNNDIVLLHNRFGIGDLGRCNGGAITGRSIRIESNSLYISQLEVIITSDMIEKNIACARDDGTYSYTIGDYLINIGT